MSNERIQVVRKVWDLLAKFYCPFLNIFSCYFPLKAFQFSKFTDPGPWISFYHPPVHTSHSLQNFQDFWKRLGHIFFHHRWKLTFFNPFRFQCHISSQPRYSSRLSNYLLHAVNVRTADHSPEDRMTQIWGHSLKHPRPMANIKLLLYI